MTDRSECGESGSNGLHLSWTALRGERRRAFGMKVVVGGGVGGGVRANKPSNKQNTQFSTDLVPGNRSCVSGLA